MVIIAGTGSAVFGLNARGETASCGGWGYIFGDEGSGYWIAVRALNACSHAEDHREPETALTRRFVERMGADSLRGVHALIYSGQVGRPEVAALSEEVGAAAAAGDLVARRILRAAGRELGLQAAVVLRKLGLTAEPIEVGCVGGVFRAFRLLRPSLAAAVRKAAPTARMVRPRVSPAAAAALLALDSLGVPIGSELIARAAASAPAGSI